jgi:hypothetical protein
MVFLHTASVLLCGLVASVASAALAAPQQRTAAEHDIKAAYLYNFTRFVSWPAGIPPGAEPFRVCVVADRTTTEAVERTMSGETVDGRPVETLVPRSATEIKACQLLFVGRNDEDRAVPMLTAARDAPVLVVGEEEAITQQGGAITFVMDRGKVRFDITSRNAQRNGLTISSRLLNVARRTDVEK